MSEVRLKTANQIFDESYTVFQKNFLENKKRIKNKILNVPMRKCNDDKEIGFWHSASMGKEEIFDMDPCNNDFTLDICEYKCNINHSQNFLDKRVPCAYRANRIKYINETIDKFNNNEIETIKSWFTYDYKKKFWKFYMRMIDGIDYVVITKVNLENDGDSKWIPCWEDVRGFYLITSFPIVMKSYRKRYDRELNNFNDLISKNR